MYPSAPGRPHLLDSLGLHDLRDDVLAYLLHFDHVVAPVDVAYEVLEGGRVRRLERLGLLLLAREVAHQSEVDVVRVAEGVCGRLEDLGYQELPEEGADGRALGDVARDARAEEDLARPPEEVQFLLARVEVRVASGVGLERGRTRELPAALEIHPAEVFEVSFDAVDQVLGDKLHAVYLTYPVDELPKDDPHLRDDAVEEPLVTFGHQEVRGTSVVLHDEVQDLFDVFVHVGGEEDGLHYRGGEYLHARQHSIEVVRGGDGVGRPPPCFQVPL